MKKIFTITRHVKFCVWNIEVEVKNFLLNTSHEYILNFYSAVHYITMQLTWTNFF